MVKTVNRTHGWTGTSLYRTWTQIIQRCCNPANPAYANYGGRGITVCDRWRFSFERFLEDMGDRPSEKHTLDRIDNNRGYAPDNCRWATRKEQNRNTRRNHLLVHNGKTMPLSAWAEEVGIDQDTISERINRHGWSVERALTQPIRTWPARK